MMRVDELERLIAALEKCAESGEPLRLSRSSTELLYSALSADLAGAGQFDPRDRADLFQIVIVHNDNTKGDTILARTLNIAIAKAMFAASVKQYHGRTIRLRQGDYTIDEKSS